MINICGSVCIPGAKHGMLELIPQTLFFLERASANTEGGSGYPRLPFSHVLSHIIGKKNFNCIIITISYYYYYYYYYYCYYYYYYHNFYFFIFLNLLETPKIANIVPIDIDFKHDVLCW